MAISANQVDGILKAYNKQYKSKFIFENGTESLQQDKYADLVTLSKYEDVRIDVEKTMTCSFIDILKSLTK